ncbi:circadian clock protein KaiC [Streptomyces purpurogeneiscleroticus]|uniref:circadian clock protein KaiC n=1 Tax=Streptomyces purpurogeneiscleroticus TaxID=68259 RepID=UPI001CC00A97|nr:circadian clock protein KaiC [Streptomyces purpurogeneiscleroticus]MBZ4018823.1 circadian clock protein KaiC [Streptomyces purpurogeneiscleroticus]
MTSGNGPVSRVATGINGFDQVALGGLPAGRCTLVTGTAGSGKTLFATEFLARGIQVHDEPGVFVTFEEPPADTRRNALSLGLTIAEWERAGKWAFVDASATSTEEGAIIGAYDFHALAARIGHAVHAIGAKRVSMDSLGTVFLRFPGQATVRQELLRVAESLESLGVTSVITTERETEYGSISRFGVEEFALNNVIVLRNNLVQERRRRTVEIVKLRGGPHRTGEWLFTIDPQDGIVIVPLAFLAPHEGAVVRDRVSTGFPDLDEMCGGGVYRDAIVLLTGPTGVGKTLTALRFVAAGVEAGERCLLYTFDETRQQLNRNASGWGMDLSAMEATGLLQVVSEYPETSSLEDHFILVRRVVEEFRPSRLVIDTLSALERIATPRALLDFFVALGAVLRPRAITTLVTSLPADRTPSNAGPGIAARIDSLTDVSVLLRYVETAGRARRAIAVLQTRGSAHDHRIREVTIDSTGLHIGDPLHGVSSVLAGYGAPVFTADPYGAADGRAPAPRVDPDG